VKQLLQARPASASTRRRARPRQQLPSSSIRTTSVRSAAVTNTIHTPQFDDEYIKTGRVRYVFHDLPLDFHENAFKAAEATHCAGEQRKFWEMHDRLFANQSALTENDLLRHAATLQLEQPRFSIGIVQPDSTVKIAKKLVGAKPYAQFKAAIDEPLASPTAATR
jgi:Thioredoxin